MPQITGGAGPPGVVTENWSSSQLEAVDTGCIVFLAGSPAIIPAAPLTVTVEGP